MNDAELDPDLERVIEVYRRLQISHARLVHEEATARGVGLTDLRLLFSLAARSDHGLLPKEATSYLGLSTGATTSLIDRLEDRGLVERVPNPNDRRSVTVMIREDGAAMVDEVKDMWREAFATAVPAESMQQFAELLEAVDGELSHRSSTVPST